MVSMERIERGAAAYLDNELVPNLPFEGGKKLLVGMAAGVLLKGYMQKLRELRTNEIAVGAGVFDKEGNVDLEMIRDELMRRMGDDGMVFHVNIPFVGAADMKFHRSDVDRLYQYIVQ